jgi:hypothetical protein
VIFLNGTKASSASIKPTKPFNYGAINKITNYKVAQNETMSLAFDFRDWKYLSNQVRFPINIKDGDIIAGNKEGSIEVDFSKLVDSDKN